MFMGLKDKKRVSLEPFVPFGCIVLLGDQP